MNNYPPGVTGNEYAIGGAQREWTADETCPHCGWEGPMLHEAHYEFGVRAFCDNPEAIEVGAMGDGWQRVLCPLTQEGFTIEMEYEPDLERDPE